MGSLCVCVYARSAETERGRRKLTFENKRQIKSWENTGLSTGELTLTKRFSAWRLTVLFEMVKQLTKACLQQAKKKKKTTADYGGCLIFFFLICITSTSRDILRNTFSRSHTGEYESIAGSWLLRPQILTYWWSVTAPCISSGLTPARSHLQFVRNRRPGHSPCCHI